MKKPTRRLEVGAMSCEICQGDGRIKSGSARVRQAANSRHGPRASHKRREEERARGTRGEGKGSRKSTSRSSTFALPRHVRFRARSRIKGAAYGRVRNGATFQPLQ